MFPVPQLLQWSDKNPQDFIDYGIDWRMVLRALGNDTITSATWTVPAGLVRGGETTTDTITTIFLGGGTAGTVYTVQCTITTAGGRTLKRNVLLQVREI